MDVSTLLADPEAIRLEKIIQHYYGPVGAVQKAENSSAFVKQESGRRGYPLDQS